MRSVAAFFLWVAFASVSASGADLCHGSLRPLAVQDFIDHPKHMLTDVTMSEPEALEARFYSLAIHGSRPAAALVNLAPSLRNAQLIALAKGMARAARECRDVNPMVSHAILDEAHRILDRDFHKTFLDYLSDDANTPRANRFLTPTPPTKPLPILLPRETPIPFDPNEPLNPVKLR